MYKSVVTPSSSGDVVASDSRFGNLCVYEPSTLQKKPSAPSEKPYILDRSLPICGRSLPLCSASCTTNAFWKNVPNVGIILLMREV